MWASAEALLHEGLAAAAAAGDTQGVGIGAHFLGHVARLRGDLAEAEHQYERALALARQTGGHAWELMEMVLLAQMRFERDDMAGAHTAVAAALARLGTQEHPSARIRALGLSGRLAALAGDHVLAVQEFETCLRLAEELGDQQGLGYAHLLAGHAALDRNDRVDAARHFAGVLTVGRETHDQLALVRGLEGVARLLATSEPARTLRLMDAAADLRQRLKLDMAPVERARQAEWLAGAQAALGAGAEPSVGWRRSLSVAEGLADALDACASSADA
jgi:tetratricopeptide (TPR) repeat protein